MSGVVVLISSVVAFILFLLLSHVIPYGSDLYFFNCGMGGVSLMGIFVGIILFFYQIYDRKKALKGEKTAILFDVNKMKYFMISGTYYIYNFVKKEDLPNRLHTLKVKIGNFNNEYNLTNNCIYLHSTMFDRLEKKDFEPLLIKYLRQAYEENQCDFYKKKGTYSILDFFSKEKLSDKLSRIEIEVGDFYKSMYISEENKIYIGEKDNTSQEDFEMALTKCLKQAECVEENISYDSTPIGFVDTDVSDNDLFKRAIENQDKTVLNYGYSAMHPILMSSISQEYMFFKKLKHKDKNVSIVSYERKGSLNGNANNIVDKWVLRLINNKTGEMRKIELYIDPYTNVTSIKCPEEFIIE